MATTEPPSPRSAAPGSRPSTPRSRSSGTRGRAPARPARADRVRELHLAGRARGRGLGAHQQVRRGLPGQALLRRLRGRRRRRAAGDRAREVAVRRRARQRPAALRAPQANMAAYYARARPGRHRARHAPRPRRPPHPRPSSVNFSGRYYHFVALRGLAARPSASTSTRCARLAQRAPPEADRRGRLGLPARCSTSPLPRDRRRGRRAVHGRHGALLGPRRGGLHPNPVESADIVTSTTHKTLAGPRAGFILCRAELGHEDRLARCSPACRAGRSATSPRPRRCASRSPRRRPSASTRAGARERRRAGGVAAGGRPPARLRRHRHAPRAAQPARQPWSGKDAEDRMHAVGLTANRNAVPFDERPPAVSSGVRLGTPGRDDARPRTPTTSARSAPSSPTCSERRRPAALARSRRRRCWPAGRCTRASAPTRPSTSDGRPARPRARRLRPPAGAAQGHAAARLQHPTRDFRSARRARSPAC